MDAEYYRDLIAHVLRGRRVVIAADVLAATPPAVAFLHDIGAERPFVLAGSRGTGPVPTTDQCEQLVLDTGGATMMASIRAFEAAITDPPPSVIDALDRYDPGREALFLATIFQASETTAGRRVYGSRRPEWAALENKVVIDELWDAAGVPRARSAVVAADAHTLGGAAATFDRGLGTAWAGDAREGWWGGAEYFRWVRSDDDEREATAFFTAHCDRVRVMPFLEGVPCSIHGIVAGSEVAVFRPVEMITLRRPESNRLLYAGLATYWDPADDDRENMRDVARRVGRCLAERVGYRGAFTIDGVMTSEGFLPTELNARVGAGLGPQAAPAGVHIGFLNRVIIEEEALDVRPDDLERLIVERADAVRGGSAYSVLPARHTDAQTHAVIDRGGAFSFAAPDDTADGEIVLGPSGVGGFIRYQPDAARVPVGPSFAPTAARVFAFADEHFGTELGPLEPARDVR